MGVRILKFADDLLLYITLEDLNEAQAMLEEGVTVT